MTTVLIYKDIVEDYSLFNYFSEVKQLDEIILNNKKV
jgi:hypothetical protein